MFFVTFKIAQNFTIDRFKMITFNFLVFYFYFYFKLNDIEL